METNSGSGNSGSSNVADVRAASVARLKRAASLPRMKDGRRPAVNGGEKPSASDGDRPDTKSSTGTVTPALENPATPQPSSPNYDQDGDEEEGDIEESPARTPTPPQLLVEDEQPPHQPAEASETVPSRGRRRSRPNSRNHSRANTPRLETQLPALADNDHIPSMLAPAPAATISARALSPNSATPHLTAGVAAVNLNLRAPPPPPFLSPVSPFLPTTTPPSLEALQGNYMAGLLRSKSLGRAHALHKLTGGNVSPESEYFPSFVAPTPPAATVPSRSNTVSGGERNAIRLVMMQKLRTRVNNTDTEAQSGAEEVFTAPAILEREREKKKRRRRSHRRSGSTSTNNTQTADERDFSSAQTTPATALSPLPPPQPTPPARLRELSDADVQMQEKQQRAYYQHQREGPFVEDEDEPPTPHDEEGPVYPVLPPRVSPSLTQETTPERSTDGGEQQNISSSASWQSSAETEVGETASARVPLVMQTGSRGERVLYGRQAREAFPVTAYDATGRDPSEPSDPADDLDGPPLLPPPRAPWNGQPSTSWVVYSPRTRRFPFIRVVIY
jgi:hypothetical protein